MQPMATSSFRELASVGWRLDRLEVFNWGTFDAKVHVLRLGLGSAVVTGPNEAGKSTLIDGLATLFAPPGTRAYNMAAGAEKVKERSEKSYVRGVIGEHSAREGSIPIRLRTEGVPSALLGVMGHPQSGAKVSFGKIMWLLGNELDGIYFFSETDIALKEVLPDLKDTRTLGDRLEKRRLQTFTSHKAFAARLARFFKFDVSALVLFGRVIAIRETGDVNEFIRQHMLDRLDVREQVEKLFRQFDEIEQIHGAVDRAARQIGRLAPVAERLATLEEKRKLIATTRELQAAAKFFFALETRRLADESRANLEEELIAAKLAEGEADTRYKECVGGEAAAQRAYDDNAETKQLGNLDHQIQSARDLMAEKNRKAGAFAQAVLAAGMRLPGAWTEARFLEVREKAKKDLGLAAGLADDAFAKAHQARTRRTDWKNELDGLRNEVGDLSRRAGRIRGGHQQARRELCAALQLKEDELPFAAELIDLRDGADDWRQAIEALLHGFGLSLLVPPEHFPKVVHYLRARTLADLRLTYFETKYLPADRTRLENSDHVRVLGKLQFKPGHPYIGWVADRIRGQFSHVCCDSETQYRSERYALMQERMAKSGERNDKDDRLVARDPGNYILGWNNESLQQALRSRIAGLQQKIEAAQKEETTQLQHRETHEKRKTALNEVLRFQSFGELDAVEATETIAKLEQQKRKLLATSNVARQLATELQLAQEATGRAQGVVKKATERRSGLEGRITQMQNYLTAAESRLRELPEDFQPENHAAAFHKLAGSEPWRLESLGLIENQALSQLNTDESRQRSACDDAAKAVRRAMQEFLDDFPEFAVDMKAEESQTDAFLGLRDRLRDEDLPKHEKRLREMMDRFTQDELSQLQFSMRNRVREDKDAITNLNLTLKEFGYSDTTYVEIEAKEAGGLVDQFRSELGACLRYSINATDVDRANAMRAARDLIGRLRAEDNFRKVVTDTTRWLTFGVRQRRRDDGEEVNYYSSSAGRSGGGRAKLAFTILGAAIAKQYGLLGSKPDDTFRLIVVDEIFGRTDEDYSKYALDLFHRFGLQLLCVCPLSPSARVVDPYVSSFHLVTKVDGRTSTITSVTAEQVQKERAKARE